MKADFDRFSRGVQRRDFAVRTRSGKRGSEAEKEKPEEEEERSDFEDEEEEKEEEEEERDPDGEEDEERPLDEEERDGFDPDEEEEEEEEERSDFPGDEEDEEHEPESGESGTDDEEEERGFIVEGYAATFGSPYQLFRGGGEAVFERIEPAAFASAEMSDVVLQYDHAGRVFARQSNGTLSLELDARGLKVRARLGGTAAGRSLYEEIRGGYTTKMSFAFTIEDSDFEELPEEEVLGFRTGSKDRYYLHTIRKIGRVFDVSAVSLPANEGTEIAARKAGLGEERERRRLAFNIAYEMAI